MIATLERERAAGLRVAGVDEVGRGPWAGPVVAAAVVLDPAALPQGLNDSKRLSAGRRVALDAEIRATARVALGQASVDEIDTLNILRATHLAMRRAVAGLDIVPDHVLVDGNRAPAFACPASCVVGGDGLVASIAAASIVAKVARDMLMQALDAQHPGYGWVRNMGYGTAEHAAGLARHGVTAHHRRSFAPIARIIASA